MSQVPPRIGLNLLTCSLAQCPIHAEATRNALDSLLDSDIGLYDWRLLVVDNASTCPRTVEMLQQLEARDARVAIEWSDENLGIARGRNLGYQLLHEWHAPEYVVELHTDMIFPEGGWLEPIISYMSAAENADAAIVGASLITSGGQWYSPRPRVSYEVSAERLQDYGTFRAEITNLARGLRKPNRVRPGLSHPAVKRWSALEAFGIQREGKVYPYDPDMPGRQNFEDTEEAFRAHRAGYRIEIHFGSVVYHHYHLTRIGLTDHNADYNANAIYCSAKHGAAWDDWNGVAGSKAGLFGKWMEQAYVR